MTLVDFLSARLDDREAEARRRLADIAQFSQAELDPEQLLREVAAQRKIIRALLDSEADRGQGGGERYYDTWDEALRSALSCLAESYSGHPDYRQGWE